MVSSNSFAQALTRMTDPKLKMKIWIVLLHSLSQKMPRNLMVSLTRWCSKNQVAQNFVWFMWLAPWLQINVYWISPSVFLGSGCLISLTQELICIAAGHKGHENVDTRVKDSLSMTSYQPYQPVQFLPRGKRFDSVILYSLKLIWYSVTTYD